MPQSGQNSTQEMEQEQAVFRALADPTRRDIITMLAENGPHTIGKISEQFDMSRPAIAKHLGILERGNIIIVKKNGRERINHLNPTALKTVADWVAHFDQFWDTALVSLKHAIEIDNP